MSLTLVTAADIEPLTLEEAKAQFRLEIDADDAIVRRYIQTARAWVEGQTKRCLAEQTWDYVIDYDWPFKYGTSRITLPLNPVTSVTSITYIDGTSPNPVLASSQYSVAARTHGSFIVPAYDVTWPAVRRVPGAITVRFVCGNNDDIPEELKQACALIVAEMYEQRTPSAAKAMHEVPFGIEALISPYRSSSIA